MPSYLILDLGASRYCDGWYFETSDASDALAYHRLRWPDHRFVLLTLRSEDDWAPSHTMLPLVDVERQRLASSATGAT